MHSGKAHTTYVADKNRSYNMMKKGTNFLVNSAMDNNTSLRKSTNFDAKSPIRTRSNMNQDIPCDPLEGAKEIIKGIKSNLKTESVPVMFTLLFLSFVQTFFISVHHDSSRKILLQ